MVPEYLLCLERKLFWGLFLPYKALDILLDKMSGYLTGFRKKAGSPYFSHNGGEATTNQRGKADYLERLELISIIIEVKPSLQKGAYELAVISYSIHFCQFVLYV